MKRFFTLLIGLMAIVGTVSSKTIYLENNWSKYNIWVGVGDTQNDSEMTWTKLLKLGNNGTYDFYIIELGENTYFHITFDNNGDGNNGSLVLSSSDYTDGTVYQFQWDNATKLTAGTAVTVYTHNLTVKTAESWSNFYIWAWNGSTNLWNYTWPGQMVSGESNVYTYTIKSLYSSINILFNQGDGQPQTCDLTANEGDNAYYIASLTGTKVNYSYGETVKTNTSGYATYVNKTALTMPSGIAYYAKDNGTGSATAYTLESAPASTPMLIHGDASTIYHFATTSSASELTYTNAFHAGTGAAITADETHHYYILSGDTFYSADNNTVATNKAYLELSQAATAKVLIFQDEEETDGINAVQNSVVKGNGGVYNLAGQRVSNDYKGIVIVNGKKMLNK